MASLNRGSNGAETQARFVACRRVSPTESIARAPKATTNKANGSVAHNRKTAPPPELCLSLSKDEHVCSYRLKLNQFVTKMPPLLGHTPRQGFRRVCKPPSSFHGPRVSISNPPCFPGARRGVDELVHQSRRRSNAGDRDARLSPKLSSADVNPAFRVIFSRVMRTGEAHPCLLAVSPRMIMSLVEASHAPHRLMICCRSTSSSPVI